MGCTEGLAKILVFVANFAFLCVGVVLMVLGVMYKINFNHYTDGIPPEYDAVKYVPVGAIVVGAIIFFIAFLGCCGACKSSTCMLTSYGAILFLIFLLQVGLGIWALIEIKDNDELKAKINDAVKQLFNKYGEKKGVVDLIQKELKCCGVNDSSYWGFDIPASCYSNENKSGTPYSRGCAITLYDALLGSVQIVAIVALTVSVVEVVGAVLALCLANCIRGRERQGAYY